MTDEDIKYVYETIKNTIFKEVKSKVNGYVQVFPDEKLDLVCIYIKKDDLNFKYTIKGVFDMVWKNDGQLKTEIDILLYSYKKFVLNRYFNN